MHATFARGLSRLIKRLSTIGELLRPVPTSATAVHEPGMDVDIADIVLRAQISQESIFRAWMSATRADDLTPVSLSQRYREPSSTVATPIERHPAPHRRCLAHRAVLSVLPGRHPSSSIEGPARALPGRPWPARPMICQRPRPRAQAGQRASTQAPSQAVCRRGRAHRRLSARSSH
jgi:hypothetical protein